MDLSPFMQQLWYRFGGYLFVHAVVFHTCVFMVFLFIWVSHGIPVYMGFSFFVPFLSPLRLTADTIHAALDQIYRDWLSNHGMGPQVLFTLRQ